MDRVTRGELEAVSKRQKLHLTVSQLTDLLNWLTSLREFPEYSEPIPRLVVSTWSTDRRIAVEVWCDAQLALAKITDGVQPNDRYPGEHLPPELGRFRAFRGYGARWPRPWEKIA